MSGEADPTAGERCIHCGKTRSAHGLSSRLCLHGAGGTEFTPTEPHTGDVEALAEVLSQHVLARPGGVPPMCECGEPYPGLPGDLPSPRNWHRAHTARAVCSSDWFAARDAATADRARREGAVEALREAAAELGTGPTMRWLYERDSCDWWGDRPVRDWLRDRAARIARSTS